MLLTMSHEDNMREREENDNDEQAEIKLDPKLRKTRRGK